MVDSSWWRLDRFKTLGIATFRGDTRAATANEEAGVERDSLVVTVPTNDKLNLLAADLVHSEFGVERPGVALHSLPDAGWRGGEPCHRRVLFPEAVY